MCEACRASQPATRGYVGSTVIGELPTDEDHGVVVCGRGHEIQLVRETPAAALR